MVYYLVIKTFCGLKLGSQAHRTKPPAPPCMILRFLTYSQRHTPNSSFLFLQAKSFAISRYTPF